MSISEFLSRMLDPSTVNIVLTLLLLFQWYNNRAKEQSIKHNLLGIRRILDSNKKQPDDTSLKEFLDATLATIGARPPFVENGKKILDSVLRRNKIMSNGKIKQTAQNL